MRLARVHGPACPACGCPASVVVKRFTFWGDPWERRVCDHCGKDFVTAVEEEEDAVEPESPDASQAATDRVVPYAVTRCPHCNGTDTVVTSTRPPHRYHKCRTCDRRFRSVEM